MRFRRMDWKVKVLGSIFISAFVLLGGYLLLTGIRDTTYSLNSRSWPTSTGEVIISRLLEKQGTGDAAVTTYYADIAFSYVVKGKQYTTGTVTQSDLIRSDRAAQENIIDRYPTGAMVKVYYDPTKSWTAYLEPGFTPDLLIPLIVGGVVFTLGVVMTYFWIRMIRLGDRAGELKIEDAF